MNKKNKTNNNTEVKVFKQFKKQQIFKQITFVFAALFLGFWINAFVLNWKLWNNLKTNILESKSKIEKKADIFIQKTDWKNSNLMNLKSSKNIDKVKTISFSFVYNPEKVKLLDVFPNINTSRIENWDWITTFIINFDKPKNFKKSEEIISFYTSKKDWTTQNINLINANFTDSNNIKYDLTTSWIIF